MKVARMVGLIETRKNPCSDQRRDSTKDLLFGLEMDQLKAEWKEIQMKLIKESMKDDLRVS